MCDLKGAQINVKRSQIWGLYDFELVYKAVEATKNTRVKVKGAVDYNMVTRYFRKFRSGWKNIDDQTVDSETMLQGNCTLRVQ